MTFAWRFKARFPTTQLYSAFFRTCICGANASKLRAIAWYDNSKNNPHNPDPTKTVTWGDQTSDEMMVGFFDVAVPAAMDKWKFFERIGRPPSPRNR